MKFNIKEIAPPKKKTEKQPDSSPSVEHDISEAFACYLENIDSGRFGIFKKKLLYQKPWFLICGLPGSGKSTLLADPDIPISFTFPSEEAGSVSEQSDAQLITWKFAENAVWLDLDGSLFTEQKKDTFRQILIAIKKKRPHRPIDGIVLTINSDVISRSDLEETKQYAQSLRRYIDLILTIWGVQPPLYCVCTHTDTIKGFNQIFSDSSVERTMEFLGAEIHADTRYGMPRIIFLEAFRKIVDSVKDIRLRRMAHENDQVKRSMICQFPYNFEALREKTALLLTFLLKKSSYSGKLPFGGFFFTGRCIPDGKNDESDDYHEPVDETIDSHPINPHQKKRETLRQGKNVTSLFSQPLFTTVIPHLYGPLESTRKKIKHDLLRISLQIASASIVVGLFLWLFLSSAQVIKKQEDTVSEDIIKPISINYEGVHTLLRIRSHYHRYTQTNTHIFQKMRQLLLLHSNNRMKRHIEQAYIQALHTLVIQPCSTGLYRQLQSINSRSGSGSSINFATIRNSLQAYLAISRNSKQHPDLFRDSGHIASTLHYTLKTILKVTGPLPDSIDSALQNITHEITGLLHHNKYPFLIKTDEHLVADTRRTLQTHFDSGVLYDIVLSRSIKKAPQRTLASFLRNRDESPIRTGEILSSVFTPDGWNTIVRKEIGSITGYTEKIDDWIFNPGEKQRQLARFYGNPDTLQSQLTRRYFTDVYQAWRDFFTSIAYAPFTDLQHGKQVLLKLAGTKSSIGLLIDTFSRWPDQFQPIGTKDELYEPIEQFKKRMLFMKEFYSTGFPAFQQSVGKVAVNLEEVSAGEPVTSVFTGKKDDPLTAACKHMEMILLPSMGTDEKDFFSHLLHEPLHHTITVLRKPVMDMLNNQWKNSVYDPFMSSFHGKYPFTDSDDEATFTTVMDFFAPEHGPIERFIKDHAAHYIIKKGQEWIIAEKEHILPLHFSPLFAVCCTHADKISRIFYTTKGKPRQWECVLRTDTRTMKKAELLIGERSFDLLSTGTVSYTWPGNMSGTHIRLNIVNTKDNYGAAEYMGLWGFMRICNTHCRYSGGNPFVSHFTLQWNTRSHIRDITLPVDVRISQAAHPFCLNMFRGFIPPEKVVIE